VVIELIMYSDENETVASCTITVINLQ